MAAEFNAEQFVKAWQTSKSMADVEKKTGMDAKKAAIKANYFRKKGVALKRFTAARSRFDIDKLKELALSLSEK